MDCLNIVLIAVSVIKISTNVKAYDMTSYFNSGTTKSLEKQWLMHRISFENALKLGLASNFGQKSVNVFMQRSQNSLVLTTGYYHTDNQVQLVFQYMKLETLPQVSDVNIEIPLQSNVLTVGGSIGKMIVHTTYRLFRNKTDLIYNTKDQDSSKSSPFRFQQVKNVGELALVIEGCAITGSVVARLDFNSVYLGHGSFNLSDCQYVIEIFNEEVGGPPVFAQYLPTGNKGINLEDILLKSLVAEMMPKLQAAMYSYINISAIVTKDLDTIRFKQESFFERTQKFMESKVNFMNINTINKNMGLIKMEDFTVTWDDVFKKLPNSKYGTLTDMVLVGLDTLYCSHTGGPIQLSKIQVVDQLRFTALQVTGKIIIDEYLGKPQFAVEISDVKVNVEIDKNYKATFKVIGWRDLEFSSSCNANLPVESMVVGYLLRELPQYIISHLDSVYNMAGSKKQPTNLIFENEEVEEEEKAPDGVSMQSHEISNDVSEDILTKNAKKSQLSNEMQAQEANSEKEEVYETNVEPQEEQKEDSLEELKELNKEQNLTLETNDLTDNEIVESSHESVDVEMKKPENIYTDLGRAKIQRQKAPNTSRLVLHRKKAKLHSRKIKAKPWRVTNKSKKRQVRKRVHKSSKNGGVPSLLTTIAPVMSTAENDNNFY